MSESFPKSGRSELRSEFDANRELDETVNSHSSDPIEYTHFGSFHAEEAANDPIMPEAITETVKWPDGIDYQPPKLVPEIEHITIDTPAGDLATPEELAKLRGRLRALSNIEKWEKEERAAAQNTGIWGRVKGWFSSEKQDNRTLAERLAELDLAKKKVSQVEPQFPDVDPSMIEEIVLDETNLPKSGISDSEQMQIQALREQLKQLREEENAQQEAARNVGFLGRVKGWFKREKQDNRTLSERLAELDTLEK